MSASLFRFLKRANANTRTLHAHSGGDGGLVKDTLDKVAVAADDVESKMKVCEEKTERERERKFGSS